jgi:UDP-N-acetylglucosamine 2-epimerase (non-hydrolysing)
MEKTKKFLFVFGTRPEALKMAPVIDTFRSRRGFKIFTCLTGQHREMVDQVLRLFRIKTDFDLNLMEQGQTLGDLTARVFGKMDFVFKKMRPDLLFVQGDTTTAFAVALKAFYERIPVAHIEAGLRTFNKYQPFPEEINRVLISHLADYHFAPTPEARSNLLREGVPRARVHVTGNTVVDALIAILPQLRSATHSLLKKIAPLHKIILVTAHRRESFGKPLLSICAALKELAGKHPEIAIVYPVHLNPNVQKVVQKILRHTPRVHLLPPLSYVEFLILMERSYLVLTDSGGVQEEAPSFRKPVLVMREVSERMEGVRIGVAKLVGTDQRRIIREASRLISDPRAYQAMSGKKNPYGDGRASERILSLTSKILKDSP